MSVNYASGLSPYEHKGKCGMKETYDDDTTVEEKVSLLADWVRDCRHLVVITGAGISTSAGIPDFRGPNGVWTLEEKGIAPKVDVTFENAHPTVTHLALVALERQGILKYVISQNVDGLHLRSGLPRNRLAELHGDIFVEECNKCHTQYIREKAVPTMALRPTGNKCTQKKERGNCRGRLHDTILDWEDNLPETELDLSDQHCRKADLVLTLGTSLQIIPCANMPLLAKKNGGKFVVVNLQPTKHDKKCDMKIHAYVDRVMGQLCEKLNIDLPSWTKPVVNIRSVHTVDTEEVPKVVPDAALNGQNMVQDDSKDIKNSLVSPKVVHGAVQAIKKDNVKHEIKCTINSPKAVPNTVQNAVKQERADDVKTPGLKVERKSSEDLEVVEERSERDKVEERKIDMSVVQNDSCTTAHPKKDNEADTKELVNDNKQNDMCLKSVVKENSFQTSTGEDGSTDTIMIDSEESVPPSRDRILNGGDLNDGDLNEGVCVAKRAKLS